MSVSRTTSPTQRRTTGASQFSLASHLKSKSPRFSKDTLVKLRQSTTPPLLTSDNEIDKDDDFEMLVPPPLLTNIINNNDNNNNNNNNKKNNLLGNTNNTDTIDSILSVDTGDEPQSSTLISNFSDISTTTRKDSNKNINNNSINNNIKDGFVIIDNNNSRNKQMDIIIDHSPKPKDLIDKYEKQLKNSKQRTSNHKKNNTEKEEKSNALLREVEL